MKRLNLYLWVVTILLSVPKGIKKIKKHKSRAKVVTFVIVALFALLTVGNQIDWLPSPMEASATWWNIDWDYYKTCPVTNKLDDYQMKLIVGKSSGGDVNCNGHCQDDFDDIRFVNIANDTEYPYWMENYTSGIQATFWINNTDNASTILMYYGNTVAPPTGNGDNTFRLFDHFADSSLDSAKWDWDASYPPTESGTELRARGLVDGHGQYVMSDNTWTYGRVRARVKVVAGEAWFGFMPSSSGGTFPSSTNWYRASNDFEGMVADLDTYDLSDWTAGTEDANYHIQDVTWLASEVEIFQDGVSVWSNTLTAHIYDSAFPVSVGGYSNKGGEVYCDWIAVMKFASTEPSWGTFGGEQTPGGNTAPSTPATPSPSNGATHQLFPSTLDWADSTDTEGDTITYYCWIDTDNNPQSGGTTLKNNASGSSASTSGYNFNLDTIYYWQVRAWDDNTSALYSTGPVWSFTTYKSLDTSDGFGGKIVVNAGTLELELSPTTWSAGSLNIPGHINTTGAYFTIWNNGSTAASIKIQINNTDNGWTFNTFANRGENIFAGNFTTDGWSSETNIAPASESNPVTTLTASLSGSSNMTFGIKIWSPTQITTGTSQGFDIYLEAEAV